MVGFSHNKAAFAAVSHLIEQNYRRIGFLGARMDPRVQRRLEGYRDAMKAASLFDPALILTTPVPTSVTMGGTLFADLLARMPDIDAVFCVNDDIALGVLFECQRRQIQVPEDMAALVASRHNPQMKTAYLSLREQGKPAKVALIAVARRLLVTANALVKANQSWGPDAKNT